MPAQVRELVIFMASPGDLSEERAAIRDVEDQLNSTFEALGVRVRVVGWEHTTPGYGRPQGRINPLVHSCDIFIGLLNRRWGSATGEFSSGFEEEFELAISRRENSESPEIGLFFAEVSPEMAADPGPQLARVLEFKQRIQRERLGLYREFRNSDNLAMQTVTFLTTHILTLLADSTSETGPQNPSGTASSEVSSRGNVIAASSQDGHEAIDESIAELTPALHQISRTLKAFDQIIWGHSDEADIDTDRLALIARSLEAQPQAMGSHLVNRLYQRRAALELTPPEVRLWLRTFFQEIGISTDPSQRTISGWDILRKYTPLEDDFDVALGRVS